MTTEVALFPLPTAEQVEHALRELEYTDRLVGYKMTPSAGNAAAELYSLPQAVLFLLGTRWDAPMLQSGFKGTINWVDLKLLSAWLRDAVGDADLADAVDEHAIPLESYMAQMKELSVIFTQRMDQYRTVRAQATPDPA